MDAVIKYGVMFVVMVLFIGWMYFRVLPSTASEYCNGNQTTATACNVLKTETFSSAPTGLKAEYLNRTIRALGIIVGAPQEPLFPSGITIYGECYMAAPEVISQWEGLSVVNWTINSTTINITCWSGNMGYFNLEVIR